MLFYTTGARPHLEGPSDESLRESGKDWYKFRYCLAPGIVITLVLGLTLVIFVPATNLSDDSKKPTSLVLIFVGIGGLFLLFSVYMCRKAHAVYEYVRHTNRTGPEGEHKKNEPVKDPKMEKLKETMTESEIRKQYQLYLEHLKQQNRSAQSSARSSKPSSGKNKTVTAIVGLPLMPFSKLPPIKQLDETSDQQDVDHKTQNNDGQEPNVTQEPEQDEQQQEPEPKDATDEMQETHETQPTETKSRAPSAKPSSSRSIRRSARSRRRSSSRPKSTTLDNQAVDDAGAEQELVHKESDCDAKAERSRPSSAVVVPDDVSAEHSNKLESVDGSPVEQNETEVVPE